MAEFVFITDEEGVVRVERRPSPLKDVALTGKKILDVVRDPASAVSPVTLASKYSKLLALVSEAELSDRLSPEEKADVRHVVVEFDAFTDSVRVERRAGEYYRTHGVQAFDPGPGAPPADRVQIGSFDP